MKYVVSPETSGVMAYFGVPKEVLRKQSRYFKTVSKIQFCDKSYNYNCHKTKPDDNTYFYTPMAYTYPKSEKLKSKKLIDQLFAEGKSVSSFPIKLIYLKSELPDKVPIQAGVAVPKKNFKSAVKRNRIKRLLRESYRLNKQIVFNNSEGTFAFLFLYLGKEMPDYVTVDKNLQAVLHKFKKKVCHE